VFLLQIKRGTPENKERPSKGEVLLTPLALYNTKFRFVKFDRAFLKNIFILFRRKFKAIKKSARMPMYIILSGSISRLAPLHLLKTYYGW